MNMMLKSMRQAGGQDDARRLNDLLALARELRMPAVASGDVHMHARGRRALQDTMTAIHVALGGKMDDGAGLVLGEQAVDELAVADVALHEDVPRVALEGGEVFQVARVGEGVEVHHRLVAHAQPVEDKVCTDKAGAAGNENHRKSLGKLIMARAARPPEAASRAGKWGIMTLQATPGQAGRALKDIGRQFGRGDQTPAISCRYKRRSGFSSAIRCFGAREAGRA